MLTIQNQLRAEIIRHCIPRVVTRPFGDDFAITETRTCEELRDAMVAIFVSPYDRDPVTSGHITRDFIDTAYYPAIRYLERRGLIRETEPQFAVSCYVLTNSGKKAAARLGFQLPANS